MISIAMCTYNGERFIKEQLDSILNQTYNNFELIITDDGSSDKTIIIIKEYIKQDKRIKLYQNDKNLGFIKNFEKAISLCSGDYIALADQDDIWKVNKLEIFLKQIKDNLLIYSDAILIDYKSKEIGKELIRPEKNLTKGKCNKSLLLLNCVSGNTLMFKRELLTNILPIPKHISYHDVWIAFVASTFGSITYTEESMTYYRRYDEQITKTIHREYKSFKDRLYIKEKLFINNNENIKKDLECFKTIIHPNDELFLLINLLIDNCTNFHNSYFNTNLYKNLKQDKDEIFFIIKKKKKQSKKCFKISSGLKLHKLTLFGI
jgi:glycosyltransferase involved in cell wall biosynthesis